MPEPKSPQKSARSPESKQPDAPRRVTMKDVARRAGVSQPTVSFVLNDRRDISVAEKTRARILEAARELKFQPNLAARALRSNKSYTVGVVADRLISEPYAGQIVRGIQQAVQPAGYMCYVVETSRSPGVADTAVRNLVAQGVAGLIYAAPGPQPIRSTDTGAIVRTIFVNCWDDNAPGAPQILADEYQGGRDAAAAVFAAGHRHVAYIGGPPDDYATVERERGLVDAAIAAGIDPASIRREHRDYHVSSGFELTRKVLAEDTPTALVCGTDRMAIGALMAAHSAGLDCPDDISIVGFDDQPEIAAQLHPPLATVALPHFQMGLVAGQLLIADDEPAGQRLIPCTYIPRGSLSAPRNT